MSAVMEESVKEDLLHQIVRTTGDTRTLACLNPETGVRLNLSNQVPNPRTLLVFDKETGRLCVKLPENKSIYIAPTEGRRIDVNTMHISCKSDTYQPGHNYGGVIIYQYNGKTEWRTANNTHCKSGYIVIQDTDSESVKQWKDEPGIVHGAIYRNAFGESVNDAHVVGEGFALRNKKSEKEKFEINSSVFNNPKDSKYHDGRRKMHELSEHCVGKIVEYWKTSGPRWVRQRNFEVKELLKDNEKNKFCVLL